MKFVGIFSYIIIEIMAVLTAIRVTIEINHN